MQKIMAAVQTRRSLQHFVPSASDQSYDSRDQFLIWREKLVNGQVVEWMGPYQVSIYDPYKKLLFVQDFDILPSRPFNIVQV